MKDNNMVDNNNNMVNENSEEKIDNSKKPNLDVKNLESKNNSEKSNENNVILIKRNKTFQKVKPNKFGRNRSNKESPYANEIIEIKRVVKVVKGGRRFRFSVLMVVGDKKGKVGYAIGKANEIPAAAKKARQKAEKSLINVSFDKKNKTIAHEVTGKHCSSKIIMYPANKGTGVIAGGSARNILTFSGIENIYAKVHGSTNKLNIIKATINALQELTKLEQTQKIRYNKE